MKTALVSMLWLAAFALSGRAQTIGAEKAEPKTGEVRRLESLTWDLRGHTLKWTVQKGTEIKGEFQPASTERYEIAPDIALMKVAAERRGIEQDEAALLHRLLNTLSVYCAQSVVWWDHGEGARITDNADRTSEEPPAAKPAAPSSNRVKPDAAPAVKPAEVKPKVPPPGVAEVHAHPAVR